MSKRVPFGAIPPSRSSRRSSGTYNSDTTGVSLSSSSSSSSSSKAKENVSETSRISRSKSVTSLDHDNSLVQVYQKRTFLSKRKATELSVHSPSFSSIDKPTEHQQRQEVTEYMRPTRTSVPGSPQVIVVMMSRKRRTDFPTVFSTQHQERSSTREAASFETTVDVNDVVDVPPSKVEQHIEETTDVKADRTALKVNDMTATATIPSTKIDIAHFKSSTTSILSKQPPLIRSRRRQKSEGEPVETAPVNDAPLQLGDLVMAQDSFYLDRWYVTTEACRSVNLQVRCTNCTFHERCSAERANSFSWVQGVR